MPKWIGNRFGSVVPIAPGTDAPSAIYNIFDQYYSKQEGGWVAPGINGASGGTLVASNPGGMEIRHFPSTGPGNFTYTSASSNATLQVLMVGGGGAGGDRGGGGGGAGGAIYWDSVPLSGLYSGPVTIPLSVGVGGGGVANNPPNIGGNAGTPSTFADATSQPGIYLVALGGGGGRSDNANSQNNAPGTTSTPQQSRGGSGGGQHECSSDQVTDSNGVQTTDPAIPANSRTYGFGFPGGRSNPGDGAGSGCPLKGGGGGGAGGGRPGSDAPGSAGGSGGPGIGPPDIPWMPTSLGQNGYFAGGGGSGVHGPISTGGSGGNGGGGAAEGLSGPHGGNPGTNGTGGGGGGSSVNASFSPGPATSGDGGNGIIVIRYPAI